MLNAGIIVPEGFIMKNTTSALQGSPLSSILCNIYLHELDNFIMNVIIPKYKNSMQFSQYDNKCHNRLTIKAIEKASEEETKKRKKMTKLKKSTKKNVKHIVIEKTANRIKYVRHLKSFIIGAFGQKKIIIRTVAEINNFLMSNLHLSMDNKKTKQVYTIGNKAKFLGMVIYNKSKNLSKSNMN